MKKINQNKELVNSLKSKGWVMVGDQLVNPSQAAKMGIVPGPTVKSKAKERTFDKNDHINIKNNEQMHPFKTYLCSLGYDVWIEYQFCRERRFRIDFAIVDLKIAIEIDGGIWMRGRSGHSSGSGIKRDQEKTTLLSAYGWKVMRITPDQQYTQYTVDMINKMKNAGRN